MYHIRGHLGRRFTLITMYHGRLRSTSNLVASDLDVLTRMVTRPLELVLIIRLRLVPVA